MSDIEYPTLEAKLDYNSKSSYLNEILEPIYRLDFKPKITREESLSKFYGQIASTYNNWDEIKRNAKPASFIPPSQDVNPSKPSRSSSELFVNGKLQGLLHEIEIQKDPRKFKEAVLRVIQLYFDGLVEDRSSMKLLNQKVWSEQLEALNAIVTSSGA